MYTSLQKSQNPPGKTTSHFTEADDVVSVSKDGVQKMTSVGSAAGFNFSNISIQPAVIPPAIQTKLSVNTPEDEYEQEANDIADRVIKTPGPVSVQRRYDEYEQEKGPQKNESSLSPQVSEAVHQTLQSPGHPMDAATQSLMGKWFGYDFGNVRIHSDELAQKSANDVNALAYTSGNNIAFNTGRYSPGSDVGKKLLAHELTHVVQQAGMQPVSSVARIIQRQQPPTPTQPTVNPTQVTQQLYDQAIASIATKKGVNPILLTILKKGKVGQTIPGAYSATSTPPPTPKPTPGSKGVPTSAPALVMTLSFDLAISANAAQLPQGAFAAFVNDPANQTGGTGLTITRLLPIITKAPPIGPNAADTLGEALVHEGTHMLLEIDKFISMANNPPDPSLSKAMTGTQTAFANYQSAAASSPRDLLVAEANRVLTPAGAKVPTKDPKVAADEVIDRLLEERFAIDQQLAAYPRTVTNATVVDAYLWDLLSEATSIKPYPKPPDTKARDQVVKLLNAVAAKVNPPPQPATPAPKVGAPPAGSSAPQKKR